MEAIGAVSAILQIAQVGAQLSLALYKVAKTLGSANKDVRYVAKDIALFATVLKNLGETFERGQNSTLYKEDAYRTSMVIVDECKNIFCEIDAILKKFQGDTASSDASISLRRAERFMWIFRKSRIQQLRGNLESLKATILLQVAVLSYANKVASGSSNADVDIDELLMLKSLVLANETTKHAYHDLLTTSGQTLISQNSKADSDLRTFQAPTPSQSTADDQQLTISQHRYPPPLSQPPYSLVVPEAQESSKSVPSQPKLNSIVSKSLDTSINYTQMWTLVDRLELALRILETAKWEQARILKNLQDPLLGDHNREASRISNLLQQLEQGLNHFGIGENEVHQAIAAVKTNIAGAGVRLEVKHTMVKRECLFQELAKIGAPWESTDIYSGSCTITRWIPGYFEDILWKHTYQILSSHLGRATEVVQNQPLTKRARKELKKPINSQYLPKLQVTQSSPTTRFAFSRLQGSSPPSSENQPQNAIRQQYQSQIRGKDMHAGSLEVDPGQFGPTPGASGIHGHNLSQYLQQQQQQQRLAHPQQARVQAQQRSNRHVSMQKSTSQSNNQAPSGLSRQSPRQGTALEQEVEDNAQGNAQARSERRRLYSSTKISDLHAIYEADKDGYPGDAWNLSHFERPSDYEAPLLLEVPQSQYSTVSTSVEYTIPTSTTNQTPSPWRLPQPYTSPIHLGRDIGAGMDQTYPSPRGSDSSGDASLFSLSPNLSPIVPNIIYSLSTRHDPQNADRSYQEPPRNTKGETFCSHEECSLGTLPTFSRKCDWINHMDKHTRPYICLEPGCEKIRGFTYSGGLLHHQREVHKQHGGLKTIYICSHRDCKRSTGTGFSRKENLQEHLRRVHRSVGSRPDEHDIPAAQQLRQHGGPGCRAEMDQTYPNLHRSENYEGSIGLDAHIIPYSGERHVWGKTKRGSWSKVEMGQRCREAEARGEAHLLSTKRRRTFDLEEPDSDVKHKDSWYNHSNSSQSQNTEEEPHMSLRLPWQAVSVDQTLPLEPVIQTPFTATDPETVMPGKFTADNILPVTDLQLDQKMEKGKPWLEDGDETSMKIDELLTRWTYLGERQLQISS